MNALRTASGNPPPAHSRPKAPTGPFVEEKQLTKRPGRNASVPLVVAAAASFALWEILAHRFLMSLPMGLSHWISGGVATALALTFVAVATRTILQQRRELERLSELREDLTQMLVHDLRSPLSAVVGALETVHCGATGDLSPRTQEMVEMALNGSQTLAGMVNDLLDVAKMEAGKPLIEREPTDIWSVVYEPVRSFRALAETRDVHLLTEIEPNTEDLHLDSERIRRLVTNLIDNAIKHTPPGGTITLRAGWFNLQRRLCLSISDTGEGIALEDQPRIFEKFAQVRPRHRGGSASTGIGLAFCKMVAEAHGGPIRVESAPGEGTTFTVEIPA